MAWVSNTPSTPSTHRRLPARCVTLPGRGRGPGTACLKWAGSSRRTRKLSGMFFSASLMEPLMSLSTSGRFRYSTLTRSYACRLGLEEDLVDHGEALDAVADGLAHGPGSHMARGRPRRRPCRTSSPVSMPAPLTSVAGPAAGTGLPAGRPARRAGRTMPHCGHDGHREQGRRAGELATVGAGRDGRSPPAPGRRRRGWHRRRAAPAGRRGRATLGHLRPVELQGAGHGRPAPGQPRLDRPGGQPQLAGHLLDRQPDQVVQDDHLALAERQGGQGVAQVDQGPG